MDAGVHGWIEAGWPILVSIVGVIAGSVSLAMQVKSNIKAIGRLEDRHEDLVNDIGVMKNRINDEIARLSLSLERLSVTIEKLEEWLNRKM